jgi:hypothetical protein
LIQISKNGALNCLKYGIIRKKVLWMVIVSDVRENNIMENGHNSGERPKRKVGRPPGSKNTNSTPKIKKIGRKRRGQLNEESAIFGGTKEHINGATTASANGQTEGDEAHLLSLDDEEGLSPFSSLLRNLLLHDRAEIGRVARELDVAENTIYRWMNGISEPRTQHLRRLPEVLPEHRNNLVYAIKQTFPGVLDTISQGITEVRKDIYARVLDLVASIEDSHTRFWQVAQIVADYALLHLDAERQGIQITYATLMPAHVDGIHSLREVITRGTEPWPHDTENKAYLGSTSLAGRAAISQRPFTWSINDPNIRFPVEVDDYEKSACAVPVVRGSSIAGVLVVSSTNPDFFRDRLATKAVEEYAHLIALSLLDVDFHLYHLINLRPMPSLKWQRPHIAHAFMNRILTYARKHEISRFEAERRVSCEMETEFEEMGRIEMEQQQKSEPAQPPIWPFSGGDGFS